MKTKLSSLFILFIIVFGINSVKSQTRNSQLDSLFQILDANNQAMGSLAIFKDDKLVYKNAIGFKNFADSIPADTHTLYKIGSVTKTYTATLIMQLVEKDKLQLDQKLSEFYPQVTNAESISIEMLLKHRSGIFNFTAEKGYLNRAKEPTSKQEILERIFSYESDFEPGSQFQYSNSNYLLLTFILEDITDQSYQQLLQEKIVDKLSLKNTYVDFPSTRTYSYLPADPWNKEMDTDASVPRGAGSIVSTAEDVAKFYDALFNEKLINQENLQRMKKIEDGYGMALVKMPFYEKTSYGHGGGIDGFQSRAAHFPKSNITIAYLSNGVNYTLNDIIIKSLEIIFEKDFSYPDFSNIYKHSTSELNALAGTYSSDQFPLDVDIMHKDGQLKGQATGQQEFPLRNVAKNTFEFKQAGLKIEFQPKNNSLILEQMGQSFTLRKATSDKK